MLIVVDHRIESSALTRLKKWGKVILFPVSDCVYPAISSHPDIFLFQGERELIIAPNTPESLLHLLDAESVKYRFGQKQVGNAYPETVHYNAAYRDGLLIGNMKYVDPEITAHYKDAKIVSTSQGYARCNHLILNEKFVLTSDQPTAMAIKEAFYVSPKEIILEGVNHGFFGGCCGIYQNYVFIHGSLDALCCGTEVREYIQSAGFEMVELFPGLLKDIGSIFFIET